MSSSSTSMMGHASSSGRLSAPPRLAHHNASVQVYDAGKGRSGFVWIADLLPDASRDGVCVLIDQAMAVIKKTVEQ